MQEGKTLHSLNKYSESDSWSCHPGPFRLTFSSFIKPSTDIRQAASWYAVFDQTSRQSNPKIQVSKSFWQCIKPKPVVSSTKFSRISLQNLHGASGAGRFCCQIDCPGVEKADEKQWSSPFGFPPVPNPAAERVLRQIELRKRRLLLSGSQ